MRKRAPRPRGAGQGPAGGRRAGGLAPRIGPRSSGPESSRMGGSTGSPRRALNALARPAPRLRHGPARGRRRTSSFPVHERPDPAPGEAAEAGRAAAGEGGRPGGRDAAGAVPARPRQHGPGRPQEGATAAAAEPGGPGRGVRGAEPGARGWGLERACRPGWDASRVGGGRRTLCPPR